jgi:integrase
VSGIEVRLDQPLFPDALGGFRDPANDRRDIRDARGEEELAWITSHTFRKTTATILDEAGLSSPTNWVTLGRR